MPRNQTKLRPEPLLKPKRQRLALVITILLFCCSGLWLTVEYIYWPYVTRPSTVTAAEAGDIQELESLHGGGMSLNYHDARKFDWTPLIAAVYARQTNTVAYLLQQGVDLEARDHNGCTALSWAVSVSDVDPDLTLVRMLVDAGAKTNASVMGLCAIKPQKSRLLKILSQSKGNEGTPIPNP
jgi:hypothetical protein